MSEHNKTNKTQASKTGPKAPSGRKQTTRSTTVPHSVVTGDISDNTEDVEDIDSSSNDEQLTAGAPLTIADKRSSRHPAPLSTGSSSFTPNQPSDDDLTASGFGPTSSIQSTSSVHGSAVPAVVEISVPPPDTNNPLNSPVAAVIAASVQSSILQGGMPPISQPSNAPTPPISQPSNPPTPISQPSNSPTPPISQPSNPPTPISQHANDPSVSASAPAVSTGPTSSTSGDPIASLMAFLTTKFDHVDQRISTVLERTAHVEQRTEQISNDVRDQLLDHATAVTVSLQLQSEANQRAIAAQQELNDTRYGTMLSVLRSVLPPSASTQLDAALLALPGGHVFSSAAGVAESKQLLAGPAVTHLLPPPDDSSDPPSPVQSDSDDDDDDAARPGSQSRRSVLCRQFSSQYDAKSFFLSGDWDHNTCDDIHSSLAATADEDTMCIAGSLPLPLNKSRIRALGWYLTGAADGAQYPPPQLMKYQSLWTDHFVVVAPSEQRDAGHGLFLRRVLRGLHHVLYEGIIQRSPPSVDDQPFCLLVRSNSVGKIWINGARHRLPTTFINAFLQVGSLSEHLVNARFLSNSIGAICIGQEARKGQSLLSEDTELLTAEYAPDYSWWVVDLPLTRSLIEELSYLCPILSPCSTTSSADSPSAFGDFVMLEEMLSYFENRRLYTGDITANGLRHSFKHHPQFVALIASFRVLISIPSATQRLPKADAAHGSQFPYNVLREDWWVAYFTRGTANHPAYAPYNRTEAVVALRLRLFESGFEAESDLEELQTYVCSPVHAITESLHRGMRQLKHFQSGDPSVLSALLTRYSKPTLVKTEPPAVSYSEPRPVPARKPPAPLTLVQAPAVTPLAYSEVVSRSADTTVSTTRAGQFVHPYPVLEADRQWLLDGLPLLYQVDPKGFLHTSGGYDKFSPGTKILQRFAGTREIGTSSANVSIDMMVSSAIMVCAMHNIPHSVLHTYLLGGVLYSTAIDQELKTELLLAVTRHSATSMPLHFQVAPLPDIDRAREILQALVVYLMDKYRIKANNQLTNNSIGKLRLKTRDLSGIEDLFKEYAGLYFKLNQSGRDAQEVFTVMTEAIREGVTQLADLDQANAAVRNFNQYVDDSRAPNLPHETDYDRLVRVVKKISDSYAHSGSSRKTAINIQQVTINEQSSPASESTFLEKMEKLCVKAVGVAMSKYNNDARNADARTANQPRDRGADTRKSGEFRDRNGSLEDDNSKYCNICGEERAVVDHSAADCPFKDDTKTNKKGGVRVDLQKIAKLEPKRREEIWTCVCTHGKFRRFGEEYITQYRTRMDAMVAKLSKPVDSKTASSLKVGHHRCLAVQYDHSCGSVVQFDVSNADIFAALSQIPRTAPSNTNLIHMGFTLCCPGEDDLVFADTQSLCATLSVDTVTGSSEETGLNDSGAALTLISSATVAKHNLPTFPSDVYELQGFNSPASKTKYKQTLIVLVVRGRVPQTGVVCALKLLVRAVVVPDLSMPLLLGGDFLRDHKVVTDHGRCVTTFQGPDGLELEVPWTAYTVDQQQLVQQCATSPAPLITAPVSLHVLRGVPPVTETADSQPPVWLDGGEFPTGLDEVDAMDLIITMPQRFLRTVKQPWTVYMFRGLVLLATLFGIMAISGQHHLGRLSAATLDRDGRHLPLHAVADLDHLPHESRAALNSSMCVVPLMIDIHMREAARFTNAPGALHPAYAELPQHFDPVCQFPFCVPPAVPSVAPIVSNVTALSATSAALSLPTKAAEQFIIFPLTTVPSAPPFSVPPIAPTHPFTPTGYLDLRCALSVNSSFIQPAGGDSPRERYFTPPTTRQLSPPGSPSANRPPMKPLPRRGAPPGAPLSECEQFKIFLSVHCTQLMPEMRPEKFPKELWPLVTDELKPRAKDIWAQFSPERIEVCLEQAFSEIRIYDQTPERLEQSHFFRAQVLVNLDAYFYPDPDNPPTIPGVEMEINLKDPSTKPVAVRMRRLQEMERASLKMRVAKMLRTGKLEKSRSDWNNPLCMVANKDKIKAFMDKYGDDAREAMLDPANEDEVIGLYRMTGDFRLLNLLTELERYPLPRIMELIDQCTENSDRYSAGDLADAFYLIKLKAASRHLTAFSTPDAHLQYKVMPQGVKSAACVWARTIANIFVDLLYTHKILIYQDDVCNRAKLFEEHALTQQAIYDKLRAHRMIYKTTKTTINFPSQKLLGHVMDHRGRSVDPNLTKHIRELAPPRNLTDVQSILGLAKVATEYVSELATIISPIQDLCRKGVNIRASWLEPQQKAFEELKRALTTTPVLMIPNINRPFRVVCDACRVGRGIGAVLQQLGTDGLWHPVAYFSRGLQDAERKFSATELELTALHNAILHWRPYLWGTYHEFEVFTDHYALCYMVTKMGGTAHSHQRLTRLCLDLQGYSFSVTHRKGSENLDADAISRLLQHNDIAYVHDEYSLRDDFGPLTESDLEDLAKHYSAPLNDQYKTQAEWIAQTVNNFRGERLAEKTALHINAFRIALSEPTESIPTENDTALLCCTHFCQDCEQPAPSNGSITHHTTVMPAHSSIPPHPDIHTIQAMSTATINRLLSNVSLGLHKPAKALLLYSYLHVLASRAVCLHAESPSHNYEHRMCNQRSIHAIRSHALKLMLEHREDCHLTIAQQLRVVAELHRRKSITPSAPRSTKSHRRRLRQRNSDSDPLSINPVGVEAPTATPADAPEIASLLAPRHPIGAVERPNTRRARERREETAEEADERRAELADNRLDAYDWMRQLCYIDPRDQQLCEIYDITMIRRKVKNGGPIVRTVAWPINAEGEYVVSRADQEDEDSHRVMELADVLPLLADMNDARNPYNDVPFPTSPERWLELQMLDPVLAPQLERLALNDGTGCINLRKYGQHPDHVDLPRNQRIYTQHEEPRFDYLYRAKLPSGALGPLVRASSITKTVRNGNTEHTIFQRVEQIVVPSDMVQSVLYEYHEKRGHTGAVRTYRTVRLEYWWPTLVVDCKTYTHECRHCELRKANNRQALVPIQEYPAPPYPHHTASIDLCGPFQPSNKEYVYILVYKCALSKWVEITPLKNKTAVTVVDALLPIFMRHGAPRHLLSDRGKEFTNKQLKSVCRLLDTHLIHITAVNPRANGLAENMMRTLKDMLSAHVNDTQTNWAEHLPAVAHIYNTTVNHANGYSPFFLLHGRACASPDTEHLTAPIKKGELDKYAIGLRDALTLAWDSLCGSAWTLKTERYNARPSAPLAFKPYRENQLVYMKRVPRRFYKDQKDEELYNLTAKLQKRYSGPYRITKVISDVLYEAQVHGKKRVLHAINIKPAHVQLHVSDVIHDEDEAQDEMDLDEQREVHRNAQLDLTDPLEPVYAALQLPDGHRAHHRDAQVAEALLDLHHDAGQ